MTTINLRADSNAPDIFLVCLFFASFRVNTRNRILSFEFLQIIYLTAFFFSRTGRKTLQNGVHVFVCENLLQSCELVGQVCLQN